MERRRSNPRPNWRRTVESQGMLFHTIDDAPYWDESACYEFSAAEVDAIERATAELEAMCLEAVEHVIERDLFGLFQIPPRFAELAARSWEADEPTIYGRFDLSFDGHGPPRLLEYNADTPTALLEAAVIQWFWHRDRLDADDFDQFNSIHERLIDAWRAGAEEFGGRISFAAMHGTLEDYMTATYLRDTALQAGLAAEAIDMERIGWNPRLGRFVDEQERPLDCVFKLYPWEWMIREAFGPHLLEETTLWVEPPWKMILSNKAILPVLHELFPDSPYVPRASFAPLGDTYVVKPILSREGANVRIVERGRTVAATGGFYDDVPCVFQDYHPLPDFGGARPVVGSWVVAGRPCGVGIREDRGPITGNTSRFVPHRFRKQG